MDLFITSVICCFLFYSMPDSNGMGSSEFMLLVPHLVLLIACGTIAQYFFKTYDSLWRYAESKEYLTLMLGGLTGFTFFLAMDQVLLKSKISVLFSLAAYSMSLLGMLLMRMNYRLYRRRGSSNNQGRIPIAIIGAGDAGVRLLEAIQHDPSNRYKTVCFIDDSIEKIGKIIHNVDVKGPIRDMTKLMKDIPVSEVVLAIPSITAEKRRAILELCSHMRCHVKTLPDTITLMQKNEFNLWNSVRDVKIEELLGREPVTFDNREVREFLQNKVVMVTGGGGSIGSELCRQIAKVSPKRIIIVDNYENNAYDIQQELKYIYKDKLDLRVEIASVREKDKIDLLFNRHRPQVVFHAAAHKHVPLMEDCPEEAIKNNILGTYNVVYAADRYGVDKFVLISTDKAVNPTNVMGASKRFCEMIVQSMKEISQTEYVAVRFGNVLDSNGSVVPLFKRQIEQGGPVTITDKRIVRFFMTIPEAAQLVLQAGSMANSAEVYVLDMGHPVKILDLAENLIRLSGHIPYSEIPIVETGLRPGEKLYEELLMKSEELIATSNHKIFIERQKEISPLELQEKMNIILRSLETDSLGSMKRALKIVVPTYKDPEEVNARTVDLDYKELLTVDDGVAMNVG